MHAICFIVVVFGEESPIIHCKSSKAANAFKLGIFKIPQSTGALAV